MQLSSGLLAGFVLLVASPPHALAQGPTPPEPMPPARRDLTIRMDLGGTEPGTSKQNFDGVVSYRGVRDLELQAGYSYTDQVFYTSNRGFLTAYRFYGDGMSYVKADATLRKYQYPTDPLVRAPNPDSSSYELVPRGELEVSHRFTRDWRAGVQYQIFPANFFWDTSSWTVNNKLSAEVEYRAAPLLRLGARTALLRDPDPARTTIKGRNGATATSVSYRTTSLVGGWARLDLDRVGLALEYLPNRDLDNSYGWSLLTTLDLRVTSTVDVRLQEIHDTYSSSSNYPGKTAEILMAAAGYRVNDALRFRGGFRWVDAPSRSGGTLIVGLELRPGLR